MSRDSELYIILIRQCLPKLNWNNQLFTSVSVRGQKPIQPQYGVLYTCPWWFFIGWLLVGCFAVIKTQSEDWQHSTPALHLAIDIAPGRLAGSMALHKLFVYIFSLFIHWERCIVDGFCTATADDMIDLEAQSVNDYRRNNSHISQACDIISILQRRRDLCHIVVLCFGV